MSEQYELRGLDFDIINTEDPDRFIDLLNFDSYTRGDVGGQIPVDRHRILFEKWLEKRDNAMRLEGANAAERIIRMSPTPKEDFRKYTRELEQS